MAPDIFGQLRTRSSHQRMHNNRTQNSGHLGPRRKPDAGGEQLPSCHWTTRQTTEETFGTSASLGVTGWPSPTSRCLQQQQPREASPGEPERLLLGRTYSWGYS